MRKVSILYKKTIIPRSDHTYSSFPTYTEYENKIYLFYRQGKTSEQFVHGYEGKVKMLTFEKTELISSMKSEQKIDFQKLGKEQTIFSNTEKNELDSIVTKLGENLYSLVTRLYLPRQLNQPHISISTTPHFESRQPINIEETSWHALYGKGFTSNEGYIFPAYGSLKKERGERPFLLQTDDFKTWKVLSAIPLSEDYILNESSVIYYNDHYIMYMRDNKKPFAIWKSESADLKTWTKPEKIIDKAHAPMAIVHNETVHLSYRDLSNEQYHASSYMMNENEDKKMILDRYTGSLYDGGYTDIGIVNNHLFITYYSGNEKAEPNIKATLLPL